MTGEAELHDRMDDDLAALRATLHRTLIDRPTWGGPSLAAGLGMYWFYRGMMLEGSRWIELGFQHLELARPADAAILQFRRRHPAHHAPRPPLPAPHLDALYAAADRATGDDLLFVGDEFAGLASPAFPSGDRELLRSLARRATQAADRTGDANSALLARVAMLRAHSGCRRATRRGRGRARAGARVRQPVGRTDVCRRRRACLPRRRRRRGRAGVVPAWRGGLSGAGCPRQRAVHGAPRGPAARRGDDVSAVRFLAGAREQNWRAAMRWPTRPETPAVLEEAARRLGAAAYEQAWRAGGGLHLADVARPPEAEFTRFR